MKKKGMEDGNGRKGKERKEREIIYLTVNIVGVFSGVYRVSKAPMSIR